MDILVDSSIWFEYFKRKEPYFSDLQEKLNIFYIRIIDPIIGELLQGALNKTEIVFIKKYIQYIPKIEIESLFEKAGEYSFKNKLISKGIGLIDACLIVAAIESNSVLWTLDKKILQFLDKKFLYEY